MNAITNEPSLRFQVQKRWRKPPPAPYSNNWELDVSCHEKFDAKDAAILGNETDNHFEYRVVDKQTDAVVFIMEQVA